MPTSNFITPGIYVREYDFSDYVQQITTTTLALIGAASKGPLNTPTAVTNETALIRAFGKPLPLLNANGTPVDAALYAAVQFFRNGGQNLIFTRVANGAVSSSYPIPGQASSSALAAATGTITFAGSVSPADGDTLTIPTGIPIINLANLTVGAAGNVAITKSGANITVAGMTGGNSTTSATGSVRLTGNVSDTNAITISDGNNTPVVFEFDTTAVGSSGQSVFSAQPSAPIPLTTSALTAPAASVLNFASGATVATAGMKVTGTGIDAGTYVVSSNSTSVTLNQPSTAGVGSGVVITFSSVLVFNDGFNPVITFQFGTGTDTSTLKHVAIGTNLAATISNLESVMNALHPSSAFTIYAAKTNDTTITYKNAFTGTATNAAILSGGPMTTTGMTGGTTATGLINVGASPVEIGASAYQSAVNLARNINSVSIGGTLLTVNTSVSGQTTFEFDSNNAVATGNTPVVIGTTAFQTLANLQAAISAVTSLGVTIVNSSSSTPQLTLTRTTGGADYNGVILKTGAVLTVTGFTGGTDATYGAIQTCLTVTALNPGSWGNALTVVADVSVIIGAPANNFDLLVYQAATDGSGLVLVERFTNLSFSSTDSRYVTKALVQGISGEFSPSQFISAAVTAGAGLVAAGSYTLGTGAGAIGVDGSAGLTATNYIGTVTGNVSTGLQALRDAKTTEFNLLAVPGVSHRDVISAAQALVEKRGDALFLVDPPFGLNVNTVVDWHNGKAVGVANAPVVPLNSSYLAIYWSWCQINDDHNGNTVWLPPSGFIAGAMATSDNQYGGPFRAAAGPVRGLLKVSNIEYNPSDDEIGLLENIQNRINPLVNFPATGVQIYGDNTAQRRLSALGSVKTRRAVMFGEKACATAVRVLQWDPNDAVTWRAFTQLCEAELSKIVAARGLAMMKVVCNESTNPPQQRQQKTLRGQLFVQENPDAAIIVLDFGIFATGAQFSSSF